MAKETPNDKRLRKEEELKDLNALGIYQKRNQPFGDKDTFGTSLSKGAEYAGKEARKESV